MRWGLSLLCVCSGCGRIGFDVAVDATDAPFPTGPFGQAVSVDALNSTVEEDDVSLTADMLEIYFGSRRSGVQGVWRSVRQHVDDPWPPPAEVVELPAINNVRISADGLTLYCASGTEPTGAGGDDLWFATRSDRTAQFSAIQAIPGINTAGDEIEPWVSRNGLALYLTYLPAAGPTGIARAERAAVTEPFGPAMVIAPLEAPGYDGGTWVREDELLLVFHSDRGTNRELYMSTRTATTDPWGGPVPITELNTTAADSDAWVSPDGHTIYFVSRISGNDDIYMATR